MVDWSLARQIARFAAGSAPFPELDHDVRAMAVSAEGQLAAYTRLQPADASPEPELVDRGEWADANLGAMGELLDPVAERLAGRYASAGPLAGALRAATSATLAAEVGLVMGYMSQRVLGQYEVSLLQPEATPRFLLVAPNLVSAGRDMGLDQESFLGWVVLHEMTHVLQFSGVPWLRPHLGALLREYMDTVEVRIDRGAAGGLPTLPDPAKLVEHFREGGLAALVQTREQRRLMNRMQALMAVVEGYAEHAMDAVGEEVLPAYAGLREAMDRRRGERSAPERILQRLLGFEMKLRQYELGKRFCDSVVDRAGIEGLNAVWESPAAVPTLHELARPDVWLARVRRRASAAA